MGTFKRDVRYRLEAMIAVAIYGAVKILPVDWASALCGRIARAIGPTLSRSRRAEQNIRNAMPDLESDEINRILRDMWENLGRVVGEYPHIDEIADGIGKDRIEVHGEENLDPFRIDGRCGILFSGHFANWELFAQCARRLGVDYAQVYRAPNNPWIRRFIHRVRKIPLELQIPKGAAGARRSLDVLKKGGQLGMLVDQKMNDGISVPFFGRNAMTAPALAQFGLRFECPVVPARLERIGGCRFRLTVFPAMELPKSDDRQRDIHDLMTSVNALLERWIREAPEQWLWLHRRWPDSGVDEAGRPDPLWNTTTQS